MSLENLSAEHQKLYREIVEKITKGETEIDKNRIDEIADLLRPFVIDDVADGAALVEEILKDRMHFRKNMFGNYVR